MGPMAQKGLMMCSPKTLSRFLSIKKQTSQLSANVYTKVTAQIPPLFLTEFNLRDIYAII